MQTIPKGRLSFPPVLAESDVAIAGKLSIRFHVAPRSALFHRPAVRVPKKITFPSSGSTISRSPIERPGSLPPFLKGRSVRCHVFPRSLERRIAPLVGDQSVVYVPT